MGLNVLKEGIKNAGYANSDRFLVRKIEKLELTLDVIKEINLRYGIDNRLNAIIDGAIRITETDRAFIALLDKTKNIVFARGRSCEFKNLTADDFSISMSIAKEVVEAKLSRFFERTANSDTTVSIAKLDLQTIYCSLLKYRDDVIGVMYADCYRLREMRPELQSSFEILATHAAISIVNS